MFVFLRKNVEIYFYIWFTMQEEPKKAGRPTKDKTRHKKGRTLSFTDAEYAELTAQAVAAKLGVSEYVIEKLGLRKPPTL